MKKYLLMTMLFLLPVAAFAQGGYRLNKEGKVDLSVLYVGGQPDFDNTIGKRPADETEASAAVRMASFEDFLKTKFTTVKAIRGSDYVPAMSDGFDVTVFDGRLPEIEPAHRGYDSKGNPDYRRARMLPYGFDRAAITIASMGEVVTRSIGAKNDWYCLCLDADAHNWVADHPIFHGPFSVTMTTRMEPTPEDAKHYTYFTGPLPDSTRMWRVQLKGYQDDRNVPIGMVARPWGYVEAHDSEYISSGVCAKTIDAVALGRHGNFFHWGFAAAPNNMTEEAKQVFANAVVYMAQFNGKPMLVRKENDRIATREYLKELKYLATMPPYEERVEWTREANEEGLKMQAAAREKQAARQTLSREEQYYLNFKPQQPMTLEEYLKRYEKEAFDLLGTDLERYPVYYDENLPYFYGGEGSYVMTVDEDCKAWNMDNHDVRLLDKAISCLEKGEDVERARRILDRYTLCSFSTAKEWRDWYRKYHKKMFFTEAGGWVFMIDGPVSLPGNDYYGAKSTREAAAIAAEKVLAEQQARTVVPTYNNPVTVSARWVPDEKGGQIEIRFELFKGFHVYREVSEKDPYISVTIDTEVLQGFQLGSAIFPPARPFGTPGTTVYDDAFTVLVPIEGKLSGPVSCTVGWQSCDDKMCTPPQSVTFRFMIR